MIEFFECPSLPLQPIIIISQQAKNAKAIFKQRKPGSLPPRATGFPLLVPKFIFLESEYTCLIYDTSIYPCTSNPQNFLLFDSTSSVKFPTVSLLRWLTASPPSRQGKRPRKYQPLSWVCQSCGPLPWLWRFPRLDAPICYPVRVQPKRKILSTVRLSPPLDPFFLKHPFGASHLILKLTFRAIKKAYGKII